MPRTTTVGTVRCNHDSPPLSDRTSMSAPIAKPPAVSTSRETLPAMTIAATALRGCTGTGIR